MKAASILLAISLALSVFGIAQTACAQSISDRQSPLLAAEDSILQSFRGNVIDRVESEGLRIRNFVDEPKTTTDSSITDRSSNRVVVTDDSEAASDGGSIVIGDGNEVNVRRNIDIRGNNRLGGGPLSDRGIRVNQENIIIPH